MLSTNFALSKLTLPTTLWTFPPVSLRNSTLPAAYSLTAASIFGVSVPAFGDGIRPLGPSTLMRRLSLPLFRPWRSLFVFSRCYRPLSLLDQNWSRTLPLMIYQPEDHGPTEKNDSSNRKQLDQSQPQELSRRQWI